MTLPQDPSCQFKISGLDSVSPIIQLTHYPPASQPHSTNPQGHPSFQVLLMTTAWAALYDWKKKVPPQIYMKHRVWRGGSNTSHSFHHLFALLLSEHFFVRVFLVCLTPLGHCNVNTVGSATVSCTPYQQPFWSDHLIFRHFRTPDNTNDTN